MRVISLVVDGLKQAEANGLLGWVFAQDADIICLQDTRCSEYDLSDKFFPPEYHAYFMDDFEHPTQNGVAIYCKQMPKAIMMGLGFADYDPRAIYIQADYQQVSVGSLLMPTGLQGDESAADKAQFMSLLAAHLEKVRAKRRDFILCGGWELVHTPADAEEAGNRTDLPGFSKAERTWLNDLYSHGYCDAFREANSDPDEYTWWPDGDDGGGLRSDTQIVSDALRPHIERAAIYTADVFSSHAPVIIDYDCEL